MSANEPIYDSILGVWCAYGSIGEYGSIATDELTFDDDGRFQWRRLRFEKNELNMPRVEGMWRIEDEVLFLDFTSTEEPNVVPRERCHLRIIDREGRLGLETIRLDDEVQNNGRMYFLKPAQPGDALRSHEIAMQKLRAPVELDEPFRRLEPLLAAAIPEAVRRLDLNDPIFCIRLYYHDTNAPGENYCTWVRVLTEPARQEVLARYRPVDVEYHLWSPTAGEANGTPARDIGLFEADLRKSREIMRLYEEVYELLCVSEDNYMRQLRELLRRVSRSLNALDWSSIAPTTDDFVVFPADGSAFYAGEYESDMEASIPCEKLELLRQRRLAP
jgi:hypothetical protein